MDEALQALLDEEAIKKVHVRYCRGVDQMDRDLIRSCYHPDATDDHGEFVGGVDAFIAYGKANLPTFLSTNHFIRNQLVSFDPKTPISMIGPEGFATPEALAEVAELTMQSPHRNQL